MEAQENEEINEEVEIDVSIIKPKYYAEYYKNGNLVIAHELKDIKDFNNDCDKTKNLIEPPFTVKLAKYVKEEISSRIYNKPLKDN